MDLWELIIQDILLWLGWNEEYKFTDNFKFVDVLRVINDQN
jgi:hypothetical protein